MLMFMGIEICHSFQGEPLFIHMGYLTLNGRSILLQLQLIISCFLQILPILDIHD